MNRFLKFYAYFIVLVIPLILQKSHANSPGEFAKLMNGTYLILGFFVCWLFDQYKKTEPLQLKWSPVMSLLSGILASVLISYTFSISYFVSFWGDKNLPADSVLSVIIFYIFSFICLQLFESKKDLERFTQIAVVTTVIQVLFGIMQRYDLYQTWFTSHVVYGTIGTTVGLSTFIGSLMPFLLMLIFNANKNRAVIFYLGLFFLTNLVMFFTSSRTPAITNIFITVLFCALQLYTRFNHTTVKKILLISLTFLLSYGFFKFDTINPEFNQKFQSKYLNKAFSSRMLVWQTALKAWQESPLIGTGPETFIFAQRKYQLAEANIYEYWDTEWPKTHNHVIQILVCTGLVGLFAHLLLLLYLSVQTTLSIQRSSCNNTDAGQNSTVYYLAYLFLFIANLTCFNFIATQMHTFLWPILFDISLANKNVRVHRFNLTQRLRALVSFLLTITVLAIGYATYNYSQSNIEQQLGIYEHNVTKNFTKSLEHYFNAVSYQDNDPLLYCQIAYTLTDLLKNSIQYEIKQKETESPDMSKLLSANEKRNTLQKILDYSQLCVNKSDGKYFIYKSRAILYSTLYYNDLLAVENVIEVYNYLIKNFPNNPESYLVLGVVYLNKAEDQKFLDLALKGIQLKPDYLPLYIELLNFYYRKDRLDDAHNLVQQLDQVQFYNLQYHKLILGLAKLAKKANDLYSQQILKKKYLEVKEQLSDAL